MKKRHVSWRFFMAQRSLQRSAQTKSHDQQTSSKRIAWYNGDMGFFDDLGSLIGEVSSMSGELKQTADDAVTNITESTEEIVSIKDELLANLENIDPTDQSK